PLEDLTEKVVPLLAHRGSPDFGYAPQLCARNRQRTTSSASTNSIRGAGDRRLGCGGSTPSTRPPAVVLGRRPPIDSPAPAIEFRVSQLLGDFVEKTTGTQCRRRAVPSDRRINFERTIPNGPRRAMCAMPAGRDAEP